MKIYSKFVDYYDSVIKSMGYETDPKLVYVREQKELSFEKIEKPTNVDLLQQRQKYKNIFPLIKRYEIIKMKQYEAISGFVLIAFCGKLYHFYKVTLQDSTGKIPGVTKYLTSNDEVLRYVNGEPNAVRQMMKLVELVPNYKPVDNLYKEVEKLLKNNKTSNTKSFMADYYRKVLKDVDSQNGCTLSDDLFIEFNTPIITLNSRDCKNDYKFTINDRLNKYNFSSHINAYDAFQEISMYIGNNLVKQIDPTINFTDEMKRDIAGFDEWSFKNPGKGKL